MLPNPVFKSICFLLLTCMSNCQDNSTPNSLRDAPIQAYIDKYLGYFGYPPEEIEKLESPSDPREQLHQNLESYPTSIQEQSFNVHQPTKPLLRTPIFTGNPIAEEHFVGQNVQHRNPSTSQETNIVVSSGASNRFSRQFSVIPSSSQEKAHAWHLDSIVTDEGRLMKEKETPVPVGEIDKSSNTKHLNVDTSRSTIETQPSTLSESRSLSKKHPNLVNFLNDNKGTSSFPEKKLEVDKFRSKYTSAWISDLQKAGTSGVRNSPLDLQIRNHPATSSEGKAFDASMVLAEPASPVNQADNILERYPFIIPPQPLNENVLHRGMEVANYPSWYPPMSYPQNPSVSNMHQYQNIPFQDQLRVPLQGRHFLPFIPPPTRVFCSCSDPSCKNAATGLARNLALGIGNAYLRNLITERFAMENSRLPIQINPQIGDLPLPSFSSHTNSRVYNPLTSMQEAIDYIGPSSHHPDMSSSRADREMYPVASSSNAEMPTNYLPGEVPSTSIQTEDVQQFENHPLMDITNTSQTLPNDTYSGIVASQPSTSEYSGYIERAAANIFPSPQQQYHPWPYALNAPQPEVKEETVQQDDENDTLGIAPRSFPFHPRGPQEKYPADRLYYALLDLQLGANVAGTARHYGLSTTILRGLFGKMKAGGFTPENVRDAIIKRFSDDRFLRNWKKMRLEFKQKHSDSNN